MNQQPLEMPPYPVDTAPAPQSIIPSQQSTQTVPLTVPAQQMKPQQQYPAAVNTVGLQSQQPQTITAQGQQLLTCQMILCQCIPPQFYQWQMCVGFFTCWSGGVALECGSCCCYGCNRPDCMQVCCAGYGMNLTAPCCFGIASSCMVGLKMMNFIK